MAGRGITRSVDSAVAPVVAATSTPSADDLRMPGHPFGWSLLPFCESLSIARRRVEQRQSLGPTRILNEGRPDDVDGIGLIYGDRWSIFGTSVQYPLVFTDSDRRCEVRPPSEDFASAMSRMFPGYTCRHAATMLPSVPVASEVLQQEQTRRDRVCAARIVQPGEEDPLN